MIKFHNIKIFYLLIVAFLFLFNPTKSQENEKLESLLNNWNFRIGPYFWFVSFSGEIINPPVPSTMPNPPPKHDIDVGFMEIKNSIKFAAMLTGQFRSDQFVTQFNFSSFVLESEAFTPKEIVLQKNLINYTFVSSDWGAGYRVIKDSQIEFEALLGLRFIYSKVGLSSDLIGYGNIEGNRDIFWIDPFIAINFKYRPHPRLELLGYGDLGILIGSESTYQFFWGVNYVISKHFYVTLAYRYLNMKDSNPDAIYSGQIKGMLLRIGVQF